MTDNNVLIAMMLLEAGLDGKNPEFGSLSDYAAAAHSFLQVAHCGKHSFEKAEQIASYFSDAALMQ